MFPELDVIEITVDPQTRQRHLNAISESLRNVKPGRGRYRLMAFAVAAVFMIPVLALAAEKSQPGDFLYPLRQVIPWSEERAVPVEHPTDPVSDQTRSGSDTHVDQPATVGTDRGEDLESPDLSGQPLPDRAVDRPGKEEPSDDIRDDDPKERPAQDETVSTLPSNDRQPDERRRP